MDDEKFRKIFTEARFNESEEDIDYDDIDFGDDDDAYSEPQDYGTMPDFNDDEDDGKAVWLDKTDPFDDDSMDDDIDDLMMF